MISWNEKNKYGAGGTSGTQTAWLSGTLSREGHPKLDLVWGCSLITLSDIEVADMKNTFSFPSSLQYCSNSYDRKKPNRQMDWDVVCLQNSVSLAFKMEEDSAIWNNMDKPGRH